VRASYLLRARGGDPVGSHPHEPAASASRAIVGRGLPASLVCRHDEPAVTDDELARLAEAGVYDPTAIDAGEQRRLLDQLVRQGITVDDLASAHRLGTIVVRAFEHLLMPGGRATLAEASAATGMDAGHVIAIRRAWGLADPPVDRACFTPAEIEAL